MKKILSCLILANAILFSAQAVHALTIEGEGYGSNREKARINAISTLASNIHVQVESKTSSLRDNKGTDDFKVESTLTTNLPIIGAKYSCKEKSAESICTAKLDSDVSLPVYIKEAQQLVDKINKDYALLAKIEKSYRIDVLTEINTQYSQYEKLNTVINVLSGWKSKSVKPNVSRRQIALEITKQESIAQSLATAAKVLIKNIKVSNIYIKPATLYNSREITPFASALYEELKHRLNTVSKISNAKYILVGSYRQNKKGIRVSYDLADRKGNTVGSAVVNLAPSSYKQYRTEPLAPDFDKLLHSGYAVSSKFNAQLQTNKGSRTLLFHGGETIELVMKVNQPSYFYLVGYIKNSHDEKSYLVDLNDASGERRFIGYINADDVNKWVSLGEFEVEKPFGVESLQLIASNKDLVGSIPSYYFDRSDGYYTISDSVKDGVKKTRGLKKKKTKKQLKSESVLLFTTEK